VKSDVRRYFTGVRVVYPVKSDVRRYFTGVRVVRIVRVVGVVGLINFHRLHLWLLIFNPFRVFCFVN